MISAGNILSPCFEYVRTIYLSAWWFMNYIPWWLSNVTIQKKICCKYIPSLHHCVFREDKWLQPVQWGSKPQLNISDGRERIILKREMYCVFINIYGIIHNRYAVDIKTWIKPHCLRSLACSSVGLEARPRGLCAVPAESGRLCCSEVVCSLITSRRHDIY